MIIKAALHTLRQPDLSADGGPRGGGRHRRRGRAAEPDRQRGARLRAADSVRARADRRQRALPRLGGGRGRRRPGRRSSSTSIRPLPLVSTDAERLRLALVNLIVNARQAVDAGRARRSARRSCRRARRGGHISILVADTGAGIASRRSVARLRSLLHHQARRHRPRAADRQEHRRRPRRHDRRRQRRRAAAPKSASTCRPRAAGRGRRRALRRARTAAAAPSSRSALMPHRGSILLVDDEEKILKALGRALRDAGHEVIETTSARAGAAPARRAAVRPAARRQRDAGAERPRPDSRVRRRRRPKASGRRC